jgi:phage baseplate assembly protein V
MWARLKLMFAQGNGVLIGAKKMQAAVLDGEPLDNVHRVEPYGFSYMPLPGCQTYIVFPGGDRTTGLALIVGDKRYQMTLVGGEVALHDDQGNHVHIKRGGVIEVKASAEVISDAPMTTATGDMVVKGKLFAEGGYYGAGGSSAQMSSGADVSGGFTVNGKDVGDGHTHTSTTPGSPTSGVN